MRELHLTIFLQRGCYHAFMGVQGDFDAQGLVRPVEKKQ
jgi:hypothetical protein